MMDMIKLAETTLKMDLAQATKLVQPESKTERRPKMQIKVYDKPDCVQCKQTQRLLDQAGVEYETASIADSPELEELIAEKGYASAPIVIFGDSSWSGFRIDKLRHAILLIKNHEQVKGEI